MKEDTNTCCNGVSNVGLPSGNLCRVIAGGGSRVDANFLGGNCLGQKLWERCIDPSKAATKLVPEHPLMESSGKEVSDGVGDGDGSDRGGAGGAGGGEGGDGEEGAQLHSKLLM